jgi:hypothetical protein
MVGGRGGVTVGRQGGPSDAGGCCGENRPRVRGPRRGRWLDRRSTRNAGTRSRALRGGERGGRTSGPLCRGVITRCWGWDARPRATERVGEAPLARRGGGLAPPEVAWCRRTGATGGRRRLCRGGRRPGRGGRASPSRRRTRSGRRAIGQRHPRTSPGITPWEGLTSRPMVRPSLSRCPDQFHTAIRCDRRAQSFGPRKVFELCFLELERILHAPTGRFLAKLLQSHLRGDKIAPAVATDPSLPPSREDWVDVAWISFVFFQGRQSRLERIAPSGELRTCSSVHKPVSAGKPLPPASLAGLVFLRKLSMLTFLDR